LDRLWLLAAENTQSALVDLVADVTATVNGSPAFLANHGYTGVDGSATVFINTGFNPTTAPSPKFTQNAAHISAWGGTNVQDIAGGVLIGLLHGDGTDETDIYPWHVSSGNAFFRINDAAASGGSFSGTSLGHWVANRSSSAASQGYHNGALFSSPNATSGALENGSFYILNGNRILGAPDAGTPVQVAQASIGGNLSSTNVSNFYSRLRTYMTAAANDDATNAWVNAVISNGGTVSDDRRVLVDNLIAGLKADGVWTKLDRLWILAAENEISARTDMVGDVLATKTGSPAFTIDRGYTGTDAQPATDYLNTGFTPSTNGVTFVQNSAHLSAWSVTNNAATNGGALSGVNVAATSANINIFDTFTDGNLYGRINDNPTSGSQGAPSSRIGHWIVNRNSSTTSQIYQNGASFSSPNATSGNVANINILILGLNQDGTGERGTPNQVAMTSLGGSLSATDATNFYNRLRTYMSSVGVP